MTLVVAVIHGMGSQKASFAEPLIEELEDRFADAGEDPGELVFESIYWAPVLTVSSPLALWSLRYDNFGTAIPFPHRKLRTRYPRVKPPWLNFFDGDDILAYPLKNLNPAYRTIVTKDIPISVGGVFTGWNPLAHTQYWTDNDFTKPVAKLLRKIWADTQP